MDRDHLTRLIVDPAVVQKDDIASLREMAARYPWFSSAHLLMAVGGHQQGDVLFDEQLRTSAAHLPSRSVLYDLVHNGSTPNIGTQVPHVAIVSEPTPVLSVVRDEPLVALPAPTALLKNIESSIPALENRLPEDFVEEVVVRIIPSASAETPSILDKDPLDEQFRNAAMASSYELLLENTPVLTPSPNKEIIVRSADPEKPWVVRSGPRRFTEWLSTAEEPASAALPANTRLDQLTAAPDAQDWLRVKPSIPVPEAQEPVTHTQALIDSFIKQSVPAFPLKKAEFFTPQQAAKRSLEDHADMVTETLARIYEKQGNASKAIAAYQRLALKHPEKGAYYLSLAQALEGR